MGNRIFILLCAVTLLACSQKPNYEGFSVTESGLNYKIHTLGDEINPLYDSDFVAISYSRFSNTGKVITENEVNYFLNFEEKSNKTMMQLLQLLSVGDSASFVDKTPDGDQLVSVKILAKISPEIALFFKRNPEFMTQISPLERLDVFMALNNFQQDSIQYVGGMFIIHQVIGSGALPENGDEVKFHMESTNVKGQVFESTHKINEPFLYVLGNQDQVIEGIDYGIRKMKTGGKATFIIPSQLAYGKLGSSTGIIKPYTTLVYQVDLLEIRG